MAKKLFGCTLWIDPTFFGNVCFGFYVKTFIFGGNNIVGNIPINMG